MTARWGRRRVAGAAGALVLVAAVAAGLLGGTRPGVLPAASGSTSTDRPSPAAPGAARAPFTGYAVAYAFHGFTGAELARLRAAVPGTVPVVTGEVAVSSGRAGYPVVPVEAMTADPAAYAAAAGDPTLAAAMTAGAVLARTEAGLRHLSTGGVLRLVDGRRFPVTAVVDDHLLGGNEAALPPSAVPRRTGTAASYALVPYGHDLAGAAVRVQHAVGARPVRTKARTDNGFLSDDDTVLTQLQVKARFGEFALRRTSDGGFEPDPRWARRWLVEADIPQLRHLVCNRAVLGHLYAAMKEVTARGLGATIHTADFQYEGGCWNPAVVPLSGGSISRHAWGIAVDINVDVNTLGGRPHQDPRLVQIMARHGFAWGGRWLRPDGMHFEYVGTTG